MRMRRKKNLEERLEKCGGYLIDCEMDDLDYRNEKNENHIVDFKSIFENDNPTVLEIGCGKGTFASTLAKQNPNINVIAVEKVANVIVAACEMAAQQGLQNIRFMRGDAEYLPSYIKEKSIETIYLNFSCPYPKARYAKHRLTHPRFLEIYKTLLADGGAIFQKTDNMHFFEFSIESFSQSGFKLSNISLDLHNSDFEGNIVTEYESKFSQQGFPIYRLEARL